MSTSSGNMTSSVTINLPIEKVVALYTDPAHFKQWQPGFQSYEAQSGAPLTEGSIAKVVFLNGKRRIELKETILANNLPHELKAFYDHEHMSNTLKTTFEAAGTNQTKLSTEPADIKFKSLIPRLLGRFMKGKFKQQGQQWIDQFKAFAEAQ